MLNEVVRNRTLNFANCQNRGLNGFWDYTDFLNDYEGAKSAESQNPFNPRF
jgi:hypothetical protein